MENHKKVTWKYIKGKLMTFHLPIILILAIGIGILLPQPGIVLDLVCDIICRSIYGKDHFLQNLCILHIYHIWIEVRY